MAERENKLVSENLRKCVYPFPNGGKHVIRDYYVNTVKVEHNVEYKRNNLGFREDRYIKLLNDGFVALGCSYTEGTGVDYYNTWPKVLEHKIGIHVYNLGLGGAGLDSMLQLAANYLERFSGKFVFILFWDYVRYNIPTQSGYMFKDELIQYKDKDIFNIFFDREAVDYYTKIKLLAIDNICRMQNKILIPLNIRHFLNQDEVFWYKGINNPYSPSNDGLHYGDDFHQEVANFMYNSYINLK